jgi:hypothetical protein
MTTLQTINLGNYANDGTGDDLRTAFQKVNANFDILRSEVTGATNMGTGIGLYARKNDGNLEFKSLTSTDNSVTITQSTNTVNLHAVTSVVTDTTPMLGGNLGLNGHTIKAINGGGIESTIWGIDIPLLNSMVELLLTSNQSIIDLGTFETPSGYSPSYPRGTDVDMGSFLIPKITNIDFGAF